MKDNIPTKNHNSEGAIAILKAGGYIKGYGDLMRVMDKDHNPVFNMPKKDFEYLKFNKIGSWQGLVWKM